MCPLRTPAAQGQSARLSVLQINLAKSKTAQDLMLQTALQHKVDVVVASEIYSPPSNNGNWAVDGSRKAAVIATGPWPIQRVWSNEEGMVAAQIGGVTFVSCYTPPYPGWTRARFDGFLTALDIEARAHQHVVVAGDFNAWHERWGSARSKPRGDALIEVVDQLDLVILNRGNVSTFVGNAAAVESVIDVSFASPAIAVSDNWVVRSDICSLSDHRYIQFSVSRPSQSGVAHPNRQDPESQEHQRSQQQNQVGTRWKLRQFHPEALAIALRASRFADTAVSPDSLTSALATACDEVMQRAPPSHFRVRTSTYWWTQDIAMLLEDCLRAENAVLASTSRVEREAAREARRHCKKALARAIKASKDACFNELIAEAEDDVYGSAYKVVMTRLRGSRVPPERDPAVLNRIVTDLFPDHGPFVWPTTPGMVADEPSQTREVTNEELVGIVSKMHSNKAPGLDGISNAVLKVAVREHTEVFRRIYQGCFDSCSFPMDWKRQRLVLLPKSGRPPGESSSFRPLGMLDGTGKILERLILDRLNDHLEDPDNPRLSPSQYGFRRGKSTMQAIQRVKDAGQLAMSHRMTDRRANRCLMVIALDVMNAFNCASWNAIALALQRKGVPRHLQRILQSWFLGRTLVYDTSEGPVTRQLTAGVPQGSVLGPTLWNVMYDAVLAIDMPAGIELVAFADDLVLLAPGTTPQAASLLAEQAVETIVTWMGINRLQLAASKTEAVLISKKKKDYTGIPVTINGVPILTTTDIRYLGVRVHCHLKWLEHVRHNTNKATKVADLLAKLMRNHSGPKHKKRRLLVGVVNSILRYAAPIWSEGVKTREIERLLQRAQKKVVVGAAFAFRTISYEAATVIAGVIPICLQVEEDARCYERTRAGTPLTTKQIRAEERLATFSSWLSDWENTRVGGTRFTRWTHRVLPDIPQWQTRKHGEVNFHLCQVLSGHGFFRQYLHHMGFTSSPDCTHCFGEEETAEHAMFTCPRFDGVRNELFHGHGYESFHPETLLQHLLRGPEDWSRISEAATRITSTLQNDWNEERANRATEEQRAISVEIENRRAATVRARNDRRNAARRRLTEERRAARLQQAPPAPPVSPRTRERIERDAQYHRDYTRQWRARRREARLAGQQQPQQQLLHQGREQQSQQQSQQNPSARQQSTQQSNMRNDPDGLNDRSSRSAMTAAEEAAISEASTSGI